MIKSLKIRVQSVKSVFFRVPIRYSWHSPSQQKNGNLSPKKEKIAVQVAHRQLSTVNSQLTLNMQSPITSSRQSSFLSRFRISRVRV